MASLGGRTAVPKALPPQLINLLRNFVSRQRVLNTVYSETERSIKIVVEQISSQRLRRIYSETDNQFPESFNVYNFNAGIRQQGKSLLIDLKSFHEKLAQAETLTQKCVQLMLWNERERRCYLGPTAFKEYSTNYNVITAVQEKQESCPTHECSSQCVQCFNSLLKEAHASVSRLTGVKFVPSEKEDKLGCLQEYKISQVADDLSYTITDEILQQFVCDSLLAVFPQRASERNSVFQIDSEKSSDFAQLEHNSVNLSVAQSYVKTRSSRSFRSLEVKAASKESLQGIFLDKSNNPVEHIWTIGENSLSFPEGVAIFEDKVAVADNLKGQVVLLDQQGKTVSCIHQRKITSLLGDWHWKPQCLAGLPNGTLAVTDGEDKGVKVFTSAGQCILSLNELNCQHPASGEFSPYGIAITPSGDFVLTHCDSFLTINTPEGRTKLEIMGVGDFWYVTTDTRGRILVSDCSNHCIRVFSSNGEPLQTIGSRGSQEGQLQYPHGLSTDDRNNILVADSLNNRVCRFSPDGRFIDHVLQGTDGVKWPRDIAISSQGQLAITWEKNVSFWHIHSQRRKPTEPNRLNMLVTYL